MINTTVDTGIYALYRPLKCQRSRVPAAQGKRGKWPKQFPVREKGTLEILPKHRENREFGNLANTQGKQGIWKFGQNTGKTQGIWKFWPKHRESTCNSVYSSCKFPDSKSKGYCDICCEICLYFFLEV